MPWRQYSSLRGISTWRRGRIHEGSWSALAGVNSQEALGVLNSCLEAYGALTSNGPTPGPCHLQVPQDEWGGYPGGGKDDEIPCRRMRSSSYVKAMGDEESGESDSSPKTSPQKSVRPDALVKAIIRPRDLLDSQSSYRLDKINSDMRNYITNFAADLSQSYHLQATRDMHPSIALDPSANYNSPKFRSRNQSYMRAVSTLSQASCVSQVSQVSETEINGQFESVCESVFSEVESQAMEALDLPGCFRTRSHSYLRAIQAGYSQDDDCIPPMASTVTSTIRSTTGIQFCLPSTCSIDRTPQQTPVRNREDWRARALSGSAAADLLRGNLLASDGCEQWEADRGVGGDDVAVVCLCSCLRTGRRDRRDWGRKCRRSTQLRSVETMVLISGGAAFSVNLAAGVRSVRE
ncbi:disks large-associated protein 2 isoform X1 [Lates japonicus]|uniref:Disks large-associated protein 2 isoform X1 n=1 Tax=Lates japonicus TaxID=270547 RepID=A0AAD3ML71_LATJO|nr:disks large-associated protein 2 isoform X1 [Lates japonicus]